MSKTPTILFTLSVVILICSLLYMVVPPTPKKDKKDKKEQAVEVDTLWLQHQVEKLSYGDTLPEDVRAELKEYLRSSDFEGDYYAIYFNKGNGWTKGYYIKVNRAGWVTSIETKLGESE